MSKKSYTTNNQNGTIAIIGNRVKLPKIGIVKVVIHQQPNETWKIKSATISQDRDGKFYASVLFEYDTEIISISKMSSNAIGLGYKSDGLYMDSNGNKADMQKYYRKSQIKLAKEQRKLSRKGEQKSNNYIKQQKKHFVKVDKWYPSSQRCSSGGNKKLRLLSVGGVHMQEWLKIRRLELESEKI